MTFQDFASKKVAGIPILYLLGGGVVILAIVAWRMKPSTDSAAADEVPADSAGPAGDGSDPYDEFETNGTVVVQPSPPPNPDPSLANQSIETNQVWVSRGVQYLVSERNVPGTQASSALVKYLAGEDRSFQEEEYVNIVIKELGPPPDGSEHPSGGVSTKTASKQFSAFPGTHTIVGGADNSFGALAGLYYNRNDKDSIDLLQAANTNLGANGPWPSGTKVKIPAYTPPRYYRVQTKAGERADKVASKNGISLVQLGRMNNSNETSPRAESVYKYNTTLRVG